MNCLVEGSIRGDVRRLLLLLRWWPLFENAIVTGLRVIHVRFARMCVYKYMHACVHACTRILHCVVYDDVSVGDWNVGQ